MDKTPFDAFIPLELPTHGIERKIPYIADLWAGLEADKMAYQEKTLDAVIVEYELLHVQILVYLGIWLHPNQMALKMKLATLMNQN